MATKKRSLKKESKAGQKAKRSRKTATPGDRPNDGSLRRSSAISKRQQRRIQAALYGVGGEETDPLDLVKQAEDSKELHLFAANWNWDDIRTADVLRSIIHNPLCDRGTALMIYWLTDGMFCQYANECDVPDWEREVYLLAMEIEHLMRTGGFQHQNIRFDPKNKQHLGGGDYRLVLKNAKRKTPPVMLAATKGTPLTEIF